jgi:uncharacterized repeat protein (TIGR04052 family)
MRFITFALNPLTLKGRTLGLLSLLLTLTCLLTACSKKPNQLTLQLLWQGQPIGCHASIKPHWQLEQVQLFLSNFSLDGQPQTLSIEAVGMSKYQQASVALLGSDCQGEQNWQLSFDKALKPGLMTFELGVPFELNHGNPLLAETPLNQSDMFWTWQQGHKFLRIDLAKALLTEPAVGKQTGWQFHLGSVACQSASVMRSPTQACKQPNRAKFSLDYQGQHQLNLDLAVLLAPVLDDPQLSQQSCMSDPASKTCQLLFSRLGLGQALPFETQQLSINAIEPAAPLWWFN